MSGVFQLKFPYVFTYSVFNPRSSNPYYLFLGLRMLKTDLKSDSIIFLYQAPFGRVVKLAHLCGERVDTKPSWIDALNVEVLGGDNIGAKLFNVQLVIPSKPGIALFCETTNIVYLSPSLLCIIICKMVNCVAKQLFP